MAILSRCYSADGTSAAQDKTVTITLSECIILSTPVASPQELVQLAGYMIGNAYPLTVPSGYNAPTLSSFDVSAEGPLKWNTTLTYVGAAFEDPDGGGGGYSEVTRIQWGSWTEEEVLDVADRIIDGASVGAQKVTNQAQDPFDPPFIKSYTNPSFKVTVRSGTNQLDKLAQVGKVNAAATSICGIAIPKWCVLLESVEINNFGTSQFDIVFSFKLKLRNQNLIGAGGEIAGKGQRGFTTLLLNAGMNQIIDGTYNAVDGTVTGGTKRPIFLPNNERASSPILLTMNGTVMASGSYPATYSEWLPHDTFVEGDLPPVLFDSDYWN